MLPAPRGPEPAVYGERGQRPVFYPTALSGDDLQAVLSIPGTQYEMRNRTIGVACAWDVADIVAEQLNTRPLPYPVPSRPPPGLQRYLDLGFKEVLWKNQKAVAMQVAYSAYKLIAEPMRGGKTLGFLAGDILADSRRTLIFAPSNTVWNWAREIARWTRQESLILSGLSGREGRLFCRECMGFGRIGDDPCAACTARNGTAYGYKLFDVPELRPERFGDENPYSNVHGPFTCSKHTSVRWSESRTLCPECREELLLAVAGARYVILNYELLVPHQVLVGGGYVGLHADLQGLADLICMYPWDCVGLDEAQEVRGWSTASKRRGITQREKTRDALVNALRVFPLTGTPFWAYTRDIWGPLDIASKGLFGTDERGVPGRRFMERYCEGQKGQYGYKANGRSELANTELPRRLERVMIRHTPEEIFAELPAEMTVVKVIEVEDSKKRPPALRALSGADYEEVIAREIGDLEARKIPVVLPFFLQELAEGGRLVIFCYSPRNAVEIFKQIEKAAQSREHKARLASQSLRTWLITADSPSNMKARDEMTARFRGHDGAAVMVTTTGVMQVGISLAHDGGRFTSNHFVSLDYVPNAILQAKDRIKRYDRPNQALHSTFYFARGTVDDRLQAIVWPRIEMVMALAPDKQAAAMADALVAAQRSETLEQLLQRHLADLRGPADDVDLDSVADEVE